MQKLFPTAAVCVVLVAALVAADGNDWPTHDHDAGGQRFSPLEQLTPANVATLQRAWTIVWKVPLGFIESLKAKGFANTGTLNIGGSIAPASGLIFIGATIDCRFRAFESRDGKPLRETELDACAHTVPMTFLGKDGRQYVVVAAGGGSYLGAKPGSKIVAFALPSGAL